MTKDHQNQNQKQEPELRAGNTTEPYAEPAPVPQGGTDTDHADGVNALDFSGGDLGAKINAAFDQGNLAVYVPNRSGLVISTPIKLRHASTVKFSNRYPEHIICKTRGKPVFEAMGQTRHWRIRDGIFDGDPHDTPSCFLLCGRAEGVEGGGQCGDTTAMEGTQVTGCWGIGALINIAGEILHYVGCHVWMTGQGDFKWTKQRATVIVGNLDYWGLPSSYWTPSKASGSCSAQTFTNCDIRCGAGDNTVFLLKGQVEDITIQPSYLNSQSNKAHILIEPGEVGAGNWVSPRVIRLLPGGRTECNGGPVNPLVLVDGLGHGGAGVYHLHIGAIGIFSSNPVLKAVNKGCIYWLDFNEGSHLEHISTLLEHKDATLSWANITSRHDVKIDCAGQAIEDSDIHIRGDCISGATYRSLIRAKNVVDFNPQAMPLP